MKLGKLLTEADVISLDSHRKKQPIPTKVVEPDADEVADAYEPDAYKHHYAMAQHHFESAKLARNNGAREAVSDWHHEQGNQHSALATNYKNGPKG